LTNNSKGDEAIYIAVAYFDLPWQHTNNNNEYNKNQWGISRSLA